MAEAAGLVIGSIALASLFSSCIELFDCFELSRNYAYDYQTACTKLQLVRVRLSQWGTVLKINIPGSENAALREHWSEEREVVGQSLYEIKRILGNTDILVNKYRLNHQEDPDSQASKGQPMPKRSVFRRRTLWAIHDKGKFDRLIQDLSFFVENLEMVIQRLNSSRVASDHARCLQSLDGSKAELEDQDSTRSDRQSTSYERTQRTQHVIAGIQHNYDDAIGLQGVFGRTKDSYRIEGLQTNRNNSFGIQGGASEDAIAHLQDRAFARQQSF